MAKEARYLFHPQHGFIKDASFGTAKMAQFTSNYEEAVFLKNWWRKWNWWQRHLGHEVLALTKDEAKAASVICI